MLAEAFVLWNVFKKTQLLLLVCLSFGRVTEGLLRITLLIMQTRDPHKQANKKGGDVNRCKHLWSGGQALTYHKEKKKMMAMVTCMCRELAIFFHNYF